MKKTLLFLIIVVMVATLAVADDKKSYEPYLDVSAGIQYHSWDAGSDITGRLDMNTESMVMGEAELNVGFNNVPYLSVNGATMLSNAGNSTDEAGDSKYDAYLLGISFGTGFLADTMGVSDYWSNLILSAKAEHKLRVYEAKAKAKSAVDYIKQNGSVVSLNKGDEVNFDNKLKVIDITVDLFGGKGKRQWQRKGLWVKPEFRLGYFNTKYDKVTAFSDPYPAVDRPIFDAEYAAEGLVLKLQSSEINTEGLHMDIGAKWGFDSHVKINGKKIDVSHKGVLIKFWYNKTFGNAFFNGGFDLEKMYWEARDEGYDFLKDEDLYYTLYINAGYKF